MSAVSPNVQQHGDEEMLLSPADVSHEDGGADGGETALRVEGGDSEHDAKVEENASWKEQEQDARSSRWPWRRSKKGEQLEKSEQADRGGEGEDRHGLFTYDWDNGERILWKASKRSRVEVVSQKLAESVGVCIVVHDELQEALENGLTF